ncbi:hypothetical protein [Ammoniphilus sp. CFH 90114]|nr:hypothetical protein [Ammoniphilus sp. CFH 90114]
MPEQETAKISEVKIGNYKKTLIDVHQWQIAARSKKSPAIRFLSWLFGN